jgi:hypothetical protein
MTQQRWLILIYRLPREPSGAQGEATLWEAHPNTLGENNTLVAAFQSSREDAYRELIARAERIQRKAALGGSNTLPEELNKVEREFRLERRRDYFRSPLRKEAASALKAARQAVRQGAGADGNSSVERSG